ncbi:MAG: hypothetical protein UY14_C0002G0024 [Parcubacteria group bacterium GW2011_GWA1_47_9]|nr:MAG: hypothetical protein UY14_C0002G0024 [Parcubacteria group bacterium GW2011_GWA1_47_9]OGZ49363.1 MAG: hypothetical protein A3C83_00710 [Candidatus Ryanbacteria bacterium RIFCSPHIGHO2_02_FULL_47_25]
MNATMSSFEKGFLFFVWGGIFLLLLTPLVVSQSFFFPFITGKNFYFRIITELIFGAWVALALLRPEYRPRKSPLLIAFSAFIFALLLATAFGVNPYHSFWSNFERMDGFITHIHLFALFLVIAHTLRSEREWFIFLNVSIGVSMIAAAHGYLQSVGSAEILGGGRPYARLGNSIYLAVYLMFHLFFVGVLFSRMRSWMLRALYALIFIFEFYVFFLAASRGALIGFSAGVLVGGFLLLILSKNKIVRAIAGTAVVFILGFSAFVFSAPQNSLIVKSDLLRRLSSAAVEDLGESPRVMIWEVALRGVKERPLFGWGPENFLYAYARFYDPDLFGNEPWFDRVHNMLLEWLVATGVVGFALYLFVFISFSWLIWKMARAGRMLYGTAILFFALIVAYIIQNIFVFDNIMTYILVVGVFAYAHSTFVYLPGSERTEYKKYSVTPAHQAGAAASIMVMVIVAYMLNAKPIQVAAQIITGLEAFKSADSQRVIRDFQTAIDLDTFGTTETRERIADTIVQIALSVDNLNQQYLNLLDFSISEMEKELQENSSPRILLFLGKLYTIRANLTGKDADKAEATYLELQRIAPNYVQTYLGLAELYLITGKSDKAVESVRTAYSLPEKHATLGSLYYPVLSVYVLAGAYNDALNLVDVYRTTTQSPLMHPVSSHNEIVILIRRAQRSGAIGGRLKLFEEMNRLFVEDYGYPQPALLGEMINLYKSVGDTGRAAELIRQYATPEMKERARIDAEKNRNERSAAIVNDFLKSLEALP